MRVAHDLTGLWRFQPDAYGEGEKAGYPQPGCDVRRWREVRLPCAFDECGPGMAGYEGAGWFRRSFDAPAEWAGRRVAVRFEGVNNQARVWLNGALAGGSDDPFLPFELPIQELLRPGEEHVIVVRADNTRRAGEVPGLERGWRPYGGILREVRLVVTNLLRVAGLHVLAEPAPAGGSLRLDVRLENGRPADADVTVTAEVLLGNEALARLSSAPISLAASGSADVRLEGAVPGALPWSPDDPRLHQVRVTLLAGGEPVDAVELPIGFRRIEVAGERLLLNGRPLFLTGFNRHEDSPAAGMAPDPETVRADIAGMKRAGANFVRLCHYPHHPLELALCDEFGLLAMCEIPLYWWRGLRAGEEACGATLAAAKRQLSALIERDRNHPSVILWSVSNETEEDRPEVAAGNAELIRLAHSLDPSRPAAHVSSYWPKAPHFEADDVLCVNGYPSWSGRGYCANPKYDFAASGRWWAQNLATLHAAFPGKPILVTEFGYPSLEGVSGSALGEDAQAAAVAAEFTGMDAPYVAGATIWCWADHPWPEEPFINRLTTSPFGMMSRPRRARSALGTVRRMFAERQGRQAPASAELPPLPYDAPLRMIRPNLESIPQVPFPEGFGIRCMRLGEAALWTDIQRDTEEFAPITDGTFEREFGDDLPATQWRCYFVTNEKGAAIGTISAWYSRDFKGQDYGRIHWVAIRPAYQGRGLGKAALSYTLNRMAEWHRRAWLATSTGRVPAVLMYLNFGFLPDMEAPRAREAWEQFRTRASHPAIDAALGG